MSHFHMQEHVAALRRHANSYKSLFSNEKSSIAEVSVLLSKLKKVLKPIAYNSATNECTRMMRYLGVWMHEGFSEDSWLYIIQ